MASNLINRLWQSFLRLNLYKKSSSTDQTLSKELISTRIYVCLLPACLIAVVIITSFMIRTIEKTEDTPSRTRFLQLTNSYPNTLYCPCSNHAITYSTFVTTEVDFHQVCSSEFIEQTWIDKLFTNENISIESTEDFRVTLSFFWQIIAGLCIASRRSWDDAVANFNTSRILTPAVSVEETIRSQVQTTFNSQIDLSQTALAHTLLAIRLMTSGDQSVSALQTNFHLRILSSGFIRMTPRLFNDCSCLNIEGCPRPATFNDSYGHLITIPGMIMDCLMLDATLASTLECYYNQTCLSLLHQSLSIDVKPLLNNSLKHFSSNSTVETLLNKLMIDKMIINTDFDLYYSQCNPPYCSYSYTRRFNIAFIITTIMGIFSGLSFGIRFLAPLIAKIILRRKNRIVPVENVVQIQVSWQHRFHIIRDRVRHIPQSIKEKAVSLNLFESSKPRTPTNIYRERLLTRFFIVLITISSIGVGFYVFLIKQNQLVTIPHPPVTIYEQLYNDHSTTLQCPCSNISIPYEAFLNITFILHQVCSSDLISPAWLHYLTLFDPTLVPEWPNDFMPTRDFRIMGASYFQLLAALCSMADISIADAQRVFNNTKFINDRVLAPSIFRQKTRAIIDSFINTTRNNFVRTFDWIYVALIASQFFNGGNINFDITLITDDQLSIKSTNYQMFSTFTETGITASTLCTCSMGYDECFIIPLLYINASYFDEFPITSFFQMVHIGCTPLLGFLNSKIGWWYNITYLEYIKETYSIVIKSQPPPDIKSLNASIFTRFVDVTTQDLVREMLLETIISNNTHFDQFYNECLPRSCTYTHKQRRRILASLLLLIAICGGLHKIFRILIPLFGKLIFSCIDWWKRRHTRRGKLIIDIVKDFYSIKST
ncbi:unnamed protein product [Adineta steineri]|uniref:Uncharacterized protein n=2 Tax=Adineta steineri TaxID=433720 RepID=A0A813UB08_9BILA|nr:unnamed protein product [Adineta steineri]CAF3671422.1 unnamed protein product [Adineta steineri]